MPLRMLLLLVSIMIQSQAQRGNTSQTTIIRVFMKDCKKLSVGLSVRCVLCLQMGLALSTASAPMMALLFKNQSKQKYRNVNYRQNVCTKLPPFILT